MVTSGNGIIEANVQVANSKTDYIPVMDHRPIIALVIPDTPGGSIPTATNIISLPKPRIRYPKNKMEGKELFHRFEQETDEMVETLKLTEQPITDDVSFLSLYNSLTKVLETATEQCFGHTQIAKRDTIKDITSTQIQALKAEICHIGGVILSIKLGSTARISAATIQYRERALMAHEWSQNTQPLEEILKKKQHQLTWELYRE